MEKNNTAMRSGRIKPAACFTLLAAVFLFCACTKPVTTARVKAKSDFYEKVFAAKKDVVFEAAKKALVSGGYPIADADLKKGLLNSSWVASTSDSHYMELFDRRDYGVNGVYHQLVVEFAEDGGVTKVRVGSRIKSLIGAIKSSGIEEKIFLVRLGNVLRNSEPNITNLGVGN